jgi:hypothetical protein
MLLTLTKGIRHLTENREGRVAPSKDERYTVAYIEREAQVILQYLSQCKKKDFGNMRMGKSTYSHNLIDRRIQKRWGIN